MPYCAGHDLLLCRTGSFGSPQLGRTICRQPSVKANGNGPGPLVRYMPPKNTIALPSSSSWNASDGLNGPECQPRSSAVMIWTGWPQSDRRDEGVSARRHHRPVSGGGARRNRTSSCQAGRRLCAHSSRRPVFAFRVAVYEVVIPVGAGDIPHFPFAVMVDQVGFVNASMLPSFDRAEHGFVPVDPPGAILFEVANRIRTTDMVSSPGIVDAFHPLALARIPPSHRCHPMAGLRRGEQAE